MIGDLILFVLVMYFGWGIVRCMVMLTDGITQDNLGILMFLYVCLVHWWAWGVVDPIWWLVKKRNVDQFARRG